MLGQPINALLRVEKNLEVLRSYAETRYAARSWPRERRVVVRIKASTKGMDIRYFVTLLLEGSAGHGIDLRIAKGV